MDYATPFDHRGIQWSLLIYEVPISVAIRLEKKHLPL